MSNAKKSNRKPKRAYRRKEVLTSAKKFHIPKLKLQSKRTVKDQIIYVRMQNDDVHKLDMMRKRFDIGSRSQMIRDLVVEAMEKVQA